MLKMKDLMDESLQALQLKKQELEATLFKLVSDKNINRKIEKPHLIVHARRDKARVMTAIQMKSNTVVQG